MKILIVTPSLGFGGAERVVVVVAKALQKKGHQITLLVLTTSENVGYQFDGAIQWNYPSVSRAMPAVLRFVRQNEFDLVFSSARNLNYYLAIFRKLKLIQRLVIRDNSVNSVMSDFSSKKAKVLTRLLAPSYKWADRIICQSKDMLEDVFNSLNTNRSKLVLINNPANPVMEPGHEARITGRLISVGRLSPEKGIDRLIRVMVNVSGDWELHLFGEGSIKSELVALVAELGLQEKIFFRGTTKNIKEELQKADVFLSGSYVEGFPNGLLEAILCGVPAIAFSCPGGTREIIDQDVNGYIVDSEEAYQKAVENSLKRNWNRAAIAAQAAEKFSFERIVNQFEATFIAAVHA